jgi:thymidine kinase
MEQKRGKIILITGPMWSGKTSEMIRQIRRARYAGYTTQVFKYAGDVRYTRDDLVVSHDGIQESALPIKSAQSIEVTGDAIFFEEGQFIDDLVEVADLLADQGYRVCISALSSDYRREPFPTISQLEAKADKSIKLTAICHGCKRSAAFTKRIVDFNGVELIGGDESYQASCRECYNKK